MIRYKAALLLMVSAGFIGLTAVRFFGGNADDSWICSRGQWVRHGNPSGPMPKTSCGVNGSQIKSAGEAITEELSKKYNRPAESFTVETLADTGAFAKGSVRFKDEAGGGLWFAAKTEKGWELAFDGNGIMNCGTANKFNFPREMVSGCLDNDNANSFVNR